MLAAEGDKPSTELAQATTQAAQPELMTPATTQAVDPASLEKLEQLIKAEQKLTSGQFNGTMSLDVDAAGEKEQQSVDFVSSFRSRNEFRHEVKGELVAGGNGKQIYMVSLKQNLYIQDEVSTDPTEAFDQVLPEAGGMLMQQNPALMMALGGNVSEQLRQNLVKVEQTQVQIDGKDFPALALQYDDKRQLVLVTSPETGLLRQVRMDLRDSLKERGVPGVNKAEMLIDYKVIRVPADDFVADAFAWSPPAGATDAAAQSDAENPARVLIGKAAPDFSLPQLSDGETVSAKDLKGSVVMLDFWASWCGPCMASMPDLNKLYAKYNEKGVKFYAINLGDSKSKVDAAVQKTSLHVPVLMDEKNTTAEIYHADAIPLRVLIGKDGLVKAAWVGIGGERAQAKAIEKALAE